MINRLIAEDLLKVFKKHNIDYLVVKDGNLIMKDGFTHVQTVYVGDSGIHVDEFQAMYTRNK